MGSKQKNRLLEKKIKKLQYEFGLSDEVFEYYNSMVIPVPKEAITDDDKDSYYEDFYKKLGDPIFKIFHVAKRYILTEDENYRRVRKTARKYYRAEFYRHGERQTCKTLSTCISGIFGIIAGLTTVLFLKK